jgi:hypothetical protein
MTNHEGRAQFQQLVAQLRQEIPETEEALHETLQMLAGAALACAGHDRTFAAQMLALSHFLSGWVMDNPVPYSAAIFTFNNQLFALACTVGGLPLITLDLPDPSIIDEDDLAQCKISAATVLRRRRR